MFPKQINMEERHVAYLSILTLCRLQELIITTATRILVPRAFQYPGEETCGQENSLRLCVTKLRRVSLIPHQP